MSDIEPTRFKPATPLRPVGTTFTTEERRGQTRWRASCMIVAHEKDSSGILRERICVLRRTLISGVVRPTTLK